MYKNMDEFVWGQKVKIFLILAIMLFVRWYTGKWLP